MKKDFNKQLKEEFNHTFEPTIDKELLKEKLNIQPVEDTKNIVFKRKLFYRLSILCSLAIVILTAVVTWGICNRVVYKNINPIVDDNNEVDIIKMFQEKYTDCSISLLSKNNIQDSVIISLIHVKSFNSQKVNKFIIYFNDIQESKVKQTTYDFIVNEVVFSGTALNKDKYIEYNVEYSRNYDLKMIMYNSNEKIFEFCTYF